MKVRGRTFGVGEGMSKGPEMRTSSAGVWDRDHCRAGGGEPRKAGPEVRWDEGT